MKSDWTMDDESSEEAGSRRQEVGMNEQRVHKMTKFFEACHAHKARSNLTREKEWKEEGSEEGRLRLKQKELKVMCDLLER